MATLMWLAPFGDFMDCRIWVLLRVDWGCPQEENILRHPGEKEKCFFEL
jgi:hypothetical protein